MKRVLILSGGWEGHKPQEVARRLTEGLAPHGFEVENATSLQRLAEDDLGSFDLIIPNWTMDKLESECLENLQKAISEGCGLGGMHGGMGDAFRGDLGYEWMVGGHFLGHPHVGPYSVQRTDESHVITDEMPASFDYESEQYYMMIDPGVTVLADTLYKHEGREVRMPVVWVQQWGRGRVFYSALGHDPDEFDRYPHVLDMTLRGLRWAAR